jgi:hypothetical protein
MRWRKAVRSCIRSERRKVAGAIRHMKDHPCQHMDRIFHGASGTGRFFSQVFGKTTRGTLSSAVDPGTGRRTYESEQYKPIIRELVSKPFKSPHDPPDFSSHLWREGV